MIASVQTTKMRPRPQEHRTEPRIVLQMQTARHGNAKLQPTVFLPGAVRASVVGAGFDLSAKARRE